MDDFNDEGTPPPEDYDEENDAWLNPEELVPEGFQTPDEVAEERDDRLNSKPETCSHGIASKPAGYSPFLRTRSYIEHQLDGDRVYGVCTSCRTMFLLTSVNELLAGGDFRQMVKDAFLEGRDEDGFAMIYEFMNFTDKVQKEDK